MHIPYVTCRQLSGGNYFISTEQALNSLRLRRLKLFAQLEADITVDLCSRVSAPCCALEVSEEDMLLLDDCIRTTDDALSPEEVAAVYYIAGYVTYKLNMDGPAMPADNVDESEFTTLVSRGRLRHPSDELFQFARFAYGLFCLFDDDSRFKCSSYVCKVFGCLYTSVPFDLPETCMRRVIRTLANCFFKGVTKVSTAQDPVSLNITERKVRKLNPGM